MKKEKTLYRSQRWLPRLHLIDETTLSLRINKVVFLTNNKHLHLELYNTLHFISQDCVYTILTGYDMATN